MLLTATLAGGVADDSRKGTVWVVNRDRGELAVFEAETGVLTTRLWGPERTTSASQSRRARPMSPPRQSTRSPRWTPKRWRPSRSRSPRCRTTSSRATTAAPYTSAWRRHHTAGAPQFAAIDTDGNSVSYTTTSDNPAARSHGPHPSLDGDTVYVAHDLGDEVSGVDVETGAIDFSITPILRAEEVIATRFGHGLWVSSRGDGTVKRIDLATGTITGSVAVGVQPESVMLTPFERTLVVSLRGSPATLAFVDTFHRILLGSVQIAGDGTFGDLAVMTSDGRYVYATFDRGIGGTGGVAVVDVRRRRVVDTWALPRHRTSPRDLVLQEEGADVAMWDAGENRRLAL